MILILSSLGQAKSPGPPMDISKTKAKLLVIASTEGEPYKSTLKYFNKQLEASGWIKGKNLEVIEYFIGNYEHTVGNIWHHVIRKEGVDAVYISGTTAGIGAKLYLLNKNLKIVFSDVTDPIGVGLIEKFGAPPKNNATGVCISVPMDEKLRFIRTLVPHVKKIGYIYADMASSKSYLDWLRGELARPEFHDLTLVTEKVPFVPGEGGYIRMAQMAEDVIQRMDSKVDVFVSPSDSLGAQDLYVRAFDRLATKPLIGLQEREVLNEWGAAAAMYIPSTEAGNIAANMVVDILNGKAMGALAPQCPKAKVIVNIKKLEKLQRRITGNFK